MLLLQEKAAAAALWLSIDPALLQQAGAAGVSVGPPARSRCRPDAPTVPRPGAIRKGGGGRTHSPGAALPSSVWIPLSLGDPAYIFGKEKETINAIKIIYL
jgi:hypothetical protein